jgi:hypothetical protein
MIEATSEQEKSIELRLQEAAAKCLSSLDAWKKDGKDENVRESLMDAVHELRRVTSRIEIDIAMAERINTNAKSIPIPEHKSKMEKKKDQKPLSEILPVAEIKKSIKKKIEIKNDADNLESSNDDTANDDAEKVTPKRRPRRKKSESSETESSNG